MIVETLTSPTAAPSEHPPAPPSAPPPTTASWPAEEDAERLAPIIAGLSEEATKKAAWSRGLRPRTSGRSAA